MPLYSRSAVLAIVGKVKMVRGMKPTRHAVRGRGAGIEWRGFSSNKTVKQSLSAAGFFISLAACFSARHQTGITPPRVTNDALWLAM
jgi:hypothetical protein